MFDLRNIEFSGTPDGDIEVRQSGKLVFTYAENHIDFTDAMIDRLRYFYTEAYEALQEEYSKFSGNRIYFRYRIVHRFIRCNFQEHDHQYDIDHHGVFHFEHVKCPMRGECKQMDIICNPLFNTNLTSRELEIMNMYYDANNTDMIADALSISIKTVEKHKSNALRKLGLHSLADFNLYASKNNIFNRKNDSRQK